MWPSAGQVATGRDFVSRQQANRSCRSGSCLCRCRAVPCPRGSKGPRESWLQRKGKGEKPFSLQAPQHKAASDVFALLLKQT